MNNQRECFVKRRDVVSRRGFLHGTALGFGGLALGTMLAREARGSDAAWQAPTGTAHFAPRAKSVIWLFMRGGVSHMESFDPKPALNHYAGKTFEETPFKGINDPEKRKRVRVVVVNDANGQQRNKIYPLQVGYQKAGRSGIEVSDFFPHIRECVDDIAIVRSMWTTDDNHGAQVQFHSGRHMLEPPVPTIGAWVNYGLGTLNENLPQFVNMGPRFFDTRDGHYLGPAYDAVPLKIDPREPLAYAKPEADVSAAEQEIQFNLVNKLDRLAAQRHPLDASLAARIKSYELAYRMQMAVPEVMDLGKESAETKKLYGTESEPTRAFGTQLLAARRMIERGVRFVQIQHGDGAAGAWDAHGGLKANHTNLARQVDQPCAALLRDLKSRGLFDETIVVFATEFGRTPGSQGSDGRDHHPYGFSVWMAGGGIKGGVVHGATDELGFHAVEPAHYVTDVHATLLKQLGLDSRRLEIPGRKRLDIEHGEVIRDILA
ncbi:MAG: DUF1501 domain-containing protein [Verrucomicrobia bacterium]|nr:DUF1501 domain-containing protein [Verrucomicrobiota bacterium]